MPRLLTLLCLPLLAHSAWAQLPSTIKACDDGDEWPPFTYFKRQGAQKSKEVAGYSVDYLRQILANHKLQLSVDLMPWKQCQSEVAAGRYALALNAAPSGERAQTYLLSDAYYALHGVYFYSVSRPAPKVSQPADLKSLKVCGMAGYNYAPFGLPAGQIDSGAINFPAAVGKLKSGRCDVVLAQREVVIGQRLSSGFNYANFPEFAMAPLPGLAPAPYHMLLSRQPAYALELLALINQGIGNMKRNGQAEALAQRYLN